MKTTINTSALKSMRSAYLDLAAEVARQRAIYKMKRGEMKAQEEEILQELFATVRMLENTLGHRPTTAQITAAMGGKMSRQEVIGQLQVAANNHYNSVGRTWSARHDTTQEQKGKVKYAYKTVTRRFAEVDEQGNLVDDGRVIVKESTVLTFGYRDTED